MLIIPAIDIIDSQCVRLTKGDYKTKVVYDANPEKVATRFVEQEARLVHIVDLDGARYGRAINQLLISNIRKHIRTPIQVGGGIRTIETAEEYLKAGIDRIIIGTKAISDSQFIKDLIDNYGASRIVVGIDVVGDKVAIEGWQQTSDLRYKDFAQTLKSLGVTEIMATDISRDGTLTTPNFDLYQDLVSMKFNVMASGGVSDLESIKKLSDIGCYGAIVGKALYEGKLDLEKTISYIKQSSSNLTKRIIPCLDVKDGRVVKGVNFENLRDAGDPVELGAFYSQEGADELVFLDITASKEKRKTVTELVSRVAKEIFIPFTVGGGINTIEDIDAVLSAGADKVSLNTAVVETPQLVFEASQKFGSQCIVVAIDAKKVGDTYRVFTHGGTKETGLEAASWAKLTESLGAGEILLTSMDRDGTKAGYDVELTHAIASATNIPIIASGGAGNRKNFVDIFSQGNADAALAASLFHFRELGISDLKNYLKSNKIPIRIN